LKVQYRNPEACFQKLCLGLKSRCFSDLFIFQTKSSFLNNCVALSAIALKFNIWLEGDLWPISKGRKAMRRKGYFWINNCSKHFFLSFCCICVFSISQTISFYWIIFASIFVEARKKIKPRSAQLELQRGIFKSELCHFFLQILLFSVLLFCCNVNPPLALLIDSSREH